ncbi:MAG: sigma-70 family RNA polymerase sigma factor [Rhodocyclaceae bacterium]|nr:sigma-70 family RNA polymerase sigma factor [Rhodocyclaceae bacterium]
MLSRSAVIEHLPRLRRYARALTGDRYAADDLVQDTLERALSRWALLRPGSQPVLWLLTIMHNLFENQRREAWRQVDAEQALAELAARPEQCDGLVLADLARALYRLPEEQRAVLLLVALEDLSYAETAQVLGIPVGTVMSRLARAHTRLARILDGEDAGPELKIVK